MKTELLWWAGIAAAAVAVIVGLAVGLPHLGQLSPNQVARWLGEQIGYAGLAGFIGWRASKGSTARGWLITVVLFVAIATFMHTR